MPPPLMNMTIVVPQGTSNHGDTDILCVPTKWTDVLFFYAVNYLAHAVTLKSLPGEKLQNAAFFILLALIYPYSGLLRGMEAIARRAAWTKGTELQKAARAGALCVVVRNRQWQPLDGQIVSNCKIRELSHQKGSEIDPDALIAATWRTKFPKDFGEGFFKRAIGEDRTVHGSMHLPPGYMIAFLPSNALIETSFTDEAAKIYIASSYNLLKAVVAIIQVLFASVTLYKTRGDQVQRYGYAAFGLTVLPYVVMSIVNLLGNILTPDFPTLYIVRSPEMTEAEDPVRGGWFDGVVGIVMHQQHDDGRSVQFEKSGDDFLVHEIEQPSTAEIEQRNAAASNAVRFQNSEPTTQMSQISVPRQDLVRVSYSTPTYASPSAPPALSYSTPSYSSPSAHPVYGSTYSNWSTQVATGTSSQEPPRPRNPNRLWIIGQSQEKADDETQKRRNDPHDHSEEDMNLGATSIRQAQYLLQQRDFHIRVPSASHFTLEGKQAWGISRRIQWTLLTFIMAAIPFAIISVMTQFQKGKSTTAQRVWTMTWLVMGTFWGSMMPSIFKIIKEGELYMRESVDAKSDFSDPFLYIFWGMRIGFMFTCALFPIGGFVVVGQMLNSYGNCVKLT